MIPGNVVIEKIEDFEGVPLRCNKSPIAAETFIAVGAEPIQIELEEIPEAVADGRIVGGESTYARFYGLAQNDCCKVINDAEQLVPDVDHRGQGLLERVGPGPAADGEGR